ncbi:MAG: hypothetical protein VYC71_09145, partial [Planctomycetota bacterium]|nr:hypothetical protein [Planctomycetota bacterium]
GDDESVSNLDPPWERSHWTLSLFLYPKTITPPTQHANGPFSLNQPPEGIKTRPLRPFDNLG